MRHDVETHVPFADMFECSILHTTSSLVVAAALEKLEISKHKSTDPDYGYNILIGHPVADKRYWARKSCRKVS